VKGGLPPLYLTYGNGPGVAATRTENTHRAIRSRLTNQSIIDQSINQSVSQSVKQSVSQSICFADKQLPVI